MAKIKLASGKRFATDVAKVEKRGTPASEAKAIMAKHGVKKMSQLASPRKRKG